MAVDKELRRLQKEQLERERNSVPRTPLPSEFLSMMTADELKNVIFDLYDQVREMNARLAEKDRELAEKDRIAQEKDRMIGILTEKLDTVIANQKQTGLDLETWIAKQQQWDKERECLLKTIADLRDIIQVMKKNRFKGTSQKRKNGNNPDNGKDNDKSQSEAEQDLTENKDGFDGNDPDGKIAAAADQCVAKEGENTKDNAVKEKVSRPYRQGITYNRMSAEDFEYHESDQSQLPAGARIIKIKIGYSYELISKLLEHRYEVVVYSLNGKVEEAYLPCDGEPVYIDKVPGTKGSAEFMAYLTYDRYQMHTPLYREVQKLLDEGMSVCRQTLGNWLYRASLPASRIVDYLLENALSEDAVVNVDETWVRVKDNESKKYKKKYTWCLVNKKERIVIYYYDNGSRGRKVLKELIGDHDIKALQSDGYNVYLYLDNELVDLEHLCCMAHARAKFKYAADQGDLDALFFLDRIGELYELERTYREMELEPNDIKEARNNGRTAQILGDMYNRLQHLLRSDHPPRGELMDKALNYLHNYWKQLTAWRKDGRYDIDNTLAERYIRPLSGERKNSLFFGSQKMAVVSATFHTLLATCHAKKVSGLNYLKEFYRRVVKGDTDYGNMLPGLIQSC